MIRTPGPPRPLARRLGFGVLAYHLLHRPAAALREIRRIGPSPWLARATGDARMRAAAARFAPPALPPAPPEWPSLRFLTGRNHWQQTVFCARSLEIAAGRGMRCEFYDDGTLDDVLSARLLRLFPGSVLRRVAESDPAVETMLPRDRYPALHSVRRLCRYHRKIFDLRAHGGGWSLYLDSDMLFHAPPTELTDWFSAPRENLFLHDRIEGLCTDPDTFSRIAEGAFVRHLNAGLVAMDDRQLDWDRLEHFVARCPEELRAHRTFEQNITAVHFAHAGGRRLDPDRYRVIYEEFTTPPQGVLIHYCWHSNPCYRAGEWRRLPRP